MNSGTIRTVIRPETLRPAGTWEQPTDEEVREIIRQAGLTGGSASQLLGLKSQVNKRWRGGRTIRNWTSGVSPIPYAAWALLAFQAGYGAIWCMTEERNK